MSIVKKQMKRTVCVVLAAFLIVTMSPFMADGWNGSGHVSAATTQQDKLVKEAKLYKGKKLASVKKAMKKNGHSLYRNFNGDWCAWYIMATSHNAGLKKLFPKTNGSKTTAGYADTITIGLALSVVNSGGGSIHFVNKGYYNDHTGTYKNQEYKPKYKPRKGDIVMFGNSGGCSHVGIVTANANGPFSAKTIEGNTSGNHWTYSKVATHTTKNRKVLAYVTPNYKGSAKVKSAAVTHTFSYSLNGGSGTFKSQTVKDGGKIILPSAKPTKKGYTFAGWYVKRNADAKWFVPNGKGWCAWNTITKNKYTPSKYVAGGKYTLNGSWTKGSAKSNYTFCAQWTPVKSASTTAKPATSTTKPAEASTTTSGFMVTESKYNATYRDNDGYTATPMYRYATKTKSTTTDGHSSLSGWTKYNTKTTTSTSGYVVGKPIAKTTSYSGGKYVEKSAVDKGYYYYAYAVANPNKTSDWTYYVDTTRANVVSHMKKGFSKSKVWSESRLRYFWYVSAKDLGSKTGKLNVTTAYCDDSTVKKGTVSKTGTHKYDLAMWKYGQCYKVKTVTTTNYFYKWSGWSDWSDWTKEVRSTGDTVKRDSEVRYWIEAK